MPSSFAVIIAGTAAREQAAMEGFVDRLAAIGLIPKSGISLSKFSLSKLWIAFEHG